MLIAKDDHDNDDDKDVFSMFETPLSTKYTIYLSENFDKTYKYVELCNGLRNVGPDDVVEFHLANYGGLIHSGTALISALFDCKAKEINMIVDAPCYSMAALFALCGTSLRLNFGTQLMFHNYSGGNEGKGGEMLDHVLHHTVLYNDLFANIAYPFLSKKEIRKLLRDGDVYIKYNATDLVERGQRHFKFHKRR